MYKKYPFYLRTTVILLGLTLFVYALFNLADVLIPLAFALMLAILLNPLANFFAVKCRFPPTIAIVVAILLAIILIVSVGYLLYMEIRSFSDQLPAFKKKLVEMSAKAQHAISQHLGIAFKQQQQYINEGEAALKPALASTAYWYMTMAFAESPMRA